LTEIALLDQPPAAMRLEAGVTQPLADFRDAHRALVLVRKVGGDRNQINVNAHASVHDIPRFPQPPRCATATNKAIVSAGM
jgi:hypothetical protein